MCVRRHGERQIERENSPEMNLLSWTNNIWLWLNILLTTTCGPKDQCLATTGPEMFFLMEKCPLKGPAGRLMKHLWSNMHTDTPQTNINISHHNRKKFRIKVNASIQNKMPPALQGCCGLIFKLVCVLNY